MDSRAHSIQDGGDKQLVQTLDSVTVMLIDGGKKSSPDTKTWDSAGKGQLIQDTDAVHEVGFTQGFIDAQHHHLGQIPATAISGNDITSSCLYVAGLAAISAGKFAPISLLLVVVILWLFRGVYSEVGCALPLNGGAYNILLNTTTKLIAAIAACLTLLSYVATAVVSASEAVYYANLLASEINPLWATVVLLGFFCILNLVGISESSVVATLIFFIHCTTLIILIVLCFIEAFRTNWQILIDNWDVPPQISVPRDIFNGFCLGLLGVSGFETSANFIEEQKPGVFPKTLRNMWFAVAFFNPLISLLSLALIPIHEMPQYSVVLLSEMGRRASGRWLEVLISVDAALVLSGAVLTGYVGVGGLMRRMALDRLLPRFLLNQNPWRKTNHWIIIFFFVTTSSLYLFVSLSGGTDNVSTLSGVYTVSFLSVMALFGVGNLLLKYKRADLKRPTQTFWGFAVIAIVGVTSALVGNIMYDVSVLAYFSVYFGATLVVVGIMMFRTRILRIVYQAASRIPGFESCMGDTLREEILKLQSAQVAFFTRRGKLSVINKAILYIRDNEVADKIKIIHCYENVDDIPKKMVQNWETMDRCYPKISIDLVLVHGKFSPGLVDYVSTKHNIPKNFMFLTCPDDQFPNNIAEFGGVRLITH
eukprot:TRINITY_DN12829_c0_g1_i1.p1 TRINITY_DN12829_c0_g1~~TRINITY_DN12829_c0_g1_i1.p1  ORF type:complete len:648 (+),score=140.32 TRINITY_DN12829_c0_g1_i1:60-2003(+)